MADDGAGKRAAFLAAVFAAPEDDAPRLAYADWLLERGDPRGEFIRAQCALVSGALDAGPRRELTRLVADLRKEHDKAWGATVARAAREWDYRRGFVERCTGAADRFVAFGEALLAEEPLRRAELWGTSRKDVAALADAPWLARLAQLKLSGALDDDALAPLAGSAHVGALESLNLSGCELDPTAAAVLARGGGLRGLGTLVLTRNGLGDEGVAALLEGPLLARCRALYLASNELTDDGVARLAASDKLAGLELLCLGNNEELGDAGAQALADSPHLAGLTRLELDGTDLRERGAVALANSENLASLRTVVVNRYNVGESGWRALWKRFGAGVRPR